MFPSARWGEWKIGPGPCATAGASEILMWGHRTEGGRGLNGTVHPWGNKVPEGHAPENPPRPTLTVRVHMHTWTHTGSHTCMHGGRNTGPHRCKCTHTERSRTVSTPGSQGSAPCEDFVLLYLILNAFRIHYFTVINVYYPCNKSFKNKN